ASPDSFEDDYDDVSLSESDRGRKVPAADGDLQSQRSKGGTGSTPNPPSPISNISTGHNLPLNYPKITLLEGRRRRVTSVAILYVLVALSFVAWLLLFALAVVKWTWVSGALAALGSRLDTMTSKVFSNPADPVDSLVPPALICRSFPDQKKCSVGWKVFGKSCYFFSMETMSWSDAKETCADQDAHLVIIDSEQEQVKND
ncbi:LECH protein, partial [Halcyon senegalensis]|nr:LECH protein [Halcyon senegalensis]